MASDSSLIVALARAAERETVASYRKVLVELLLERAPQDLHGWFHSAAYMPYDFEKVNRLAAKVCELDGRISDPADRFAVSQRAIYLRAAERCAEIFMEDRDYARALEFYQRVRTVAPERQASIGWRAAIALIALKRWDEVEEWFSAPEAQSPFPLGDFANRALLKLIRADDNVERARIVEEVKARNPYLVDYLAAKKRIPASMPKRPKTIYQGSKYEALMYLEVALFAWLENVSVLAAVSTLEESPNALLATASDQATSTEIKLLIGRAPTCDEVLAKVASFNFSAPELRYRMDVVKHPDLWMYFFAMARAWWDEQTWETVGQREMFLLDPKPLGARFADRQSSLVSTMGALDQSFGIHLFDTFEDHHYLVACEGNSLLDKTRALRSFSSTSFEFVPVHEVSEEMRCLLEMCNIAPIGSKKLVPEIRRYRRGFMFSLPVEGRLIELIYAMFVGISMHRSILQGSDPWDGLPNNAQLRLWINFTAVQRWLSEVEIDEYAEHPIMNGARFNHSEVRKQIVTPPRIDAEWQVGWSYLPAWIAGSKDAPAVAPVVLLVVDKGTGTVLSFKQGARGESLPDLFIKALVDAVKATGKKPKRLKVDFKIDFDPVAPILKAAGIQVIRDVQMDRVDEALLGLMSFMREGSNDDLV